MSVTADDVRHIAALARLGVDDARVPRLVEELNRILEHMQELRRIDTEGVIAVEGVGAGGTPLREDAGDPVALEHVREAFAPLMRDGLFLVPRLSTHEATTEDAS